MDSKPRLFLHSPVFRHPLALSLLLACATSWACSTEARVEPTQAVAPTASAPSIVTQIDPTPATPAAPRVGRGSDATESIKADAAVQELSSLRQIPKDSIKSWRKSLDLMAHLSKRGEKSVEMRRIILDALAANSDAEYHAIMRRLRDKVSESKKVATVATSAADVSRPLTAGDVVAKPRFVNAMNVLPNSDVSFAYSPAASASDGARPGALRPATLLDDCSSTWEGVQYVGECATSEEIANAIASVEALSTELTADYSEARALCELTALDGCPAVYRSPSGDHRGSIILASSPSLVAAPTFAASLDNLRGAPCSAPYLVSEGSNEPNTNNSCALEGLMAGVSMGMWLIAKLGAIDVFRYGASRNGTIVVVTGILVGGFSAGISIGMWYNCVKARTPQ